MASSNRLAKSLNGVICGIIMIILSICLLVWNEIQTVATRKALSEAKMMTTSLLEENLDDVDVVDLKQKFDSNNNTFDINIDPENDGKCIHISGIVKSSTSSSGTAIADYGDGSNIDKNMLQDEIFGVRFYENDVIKYKRNVKMYQWVEKKSTSTNQNKGAVGASEVSKTPTAYTYDKEWISYRVESNAFYDSKNYMNPAMPFLPTTLVPDTIKLGPFTLSNQVIDKIDWYQSIDMALTVADYSDQISIENIPQTTITNYTAKEQTGGEEGGTNNDNNMIQVTAYGQKGYYFGKGDLNYPQIGDTKVTFDIIPSQTISIIGRQSSTTIENFVTSNGHNILLVEKGLISKDDMFIHAKNKDITFTETILLRFVGFGLVWISLQAIYKPLLSIFQDTIPTSLSDYILQPGVGCASTGIIALSISIIVITIPWLVYRPILAIIIITLTLFTFSSLGYHTCSANTHKYEYISGGSDSVIFEMSRIRQDDHDDDTDEIDDEDQ